MLDRVSNLQFRHLMEGHDLVTGFFQTINDMLLVKGLMLQSGAVVAGTVIAATSSAKNSTGKRAPEMDQANKGNQWHHGMKAHICADTDSDLVLTVVGTAANLNDVTQARALVNGNEADFYIHADARNQGVAKREEIKEIKVSETTWHIAMRPGKRRAQDEQSQFGSVLERIEQLKASI